MQTRFEAVPEVVSIMGERPIDRLTSGFAFLIIAALMVLYVGGVDSYDGKMIAFSSCIAANFAAVFAAGLYRLVTLRRSEMPRGIWLLLGASGIGQFAVLFLACLIPVHACGVWSLAGLVTFCGLAVSIPASLWFSPLIKEMDDKGASWEGGWWLATVLMQAAFVAGFILHIWPNLQGWCKAAAG